GQFQTAVIGDRHVPMGSFGKMESGDGSLYNGRFPLSFSRVGGPGFPLAKSAYDPVNRNFGSAHAGGVCQFIMAENNLLVLTPAVPEALLGPPMVREGKKP